MNSISTIFFCVALLALPGCDEPYLRQPLAGSPDSLETGINASQIARIQEKIGVEQNTFSFAITADTHEDHQELRSLLDHVRSDTLIEFILICGDVTNKGNQNELKKYHEIMREQT